MWKLLAAALILAPTIAQANQCRFEAPRDATLDLTGVHTLVIELGQHTLHLNGNAAETPRIHGRACASAQEFLPSTQLTQRREGDRLILTAENPSSHENFFSLFGASHYAWLDLNISVPPTIAVELKLGSGDASIANVAQLDASVGSGNLVVKSVQGGFQAHVGSGDITANDVGETRIPSVGSGDVVINRVRGNLAIGSIGSGSADLRAIGGNVEVKTIGSGDLRVNGVAHDLHVASIGSGDVTHQAVAGKVDVRHQD